jgi:hypothetical protein
MTMSAVATAAAPESTIPQVLEPDSALPDVPLHPAPWQLTASAYMLLVKLPEQVLEQGAFVPPALVGRRRSRVSVVLLVDYQKADCGPYAELMIIPAAFAFDQGNYLTITRIFVSTYESAVNGRRNWGIPKDRADFAWERDPQGCDRVRLSRDGRTFADFELRAFGPSLPVRSWMLPTGVRVLMQHWNNQSYTFELLARGSMRMASLKRSSFDAQYFPDLAQGRVLAAAHFPKFEMIFPVPEVKPL